MLKLNLIFINCKNKAYSRGRDSFELSSAFDETSAAAVRIGSAPKHAQSNDLLDSHKETPVIGAKGE